MTWVCTSVLVVAPHMSLAQPMADDEVLATAGDRIEELRKGNCVVVVVDAAGKPVEGAKVTLTQTRHDFLFGANIFMWGRLGDPEDEATYRRRFADLLNYATLGFYWWAYEREQGQPGYAYTDQVAEWCRDQGITCKGHPLVWDYQDPTWLPQDFDEIKRLSDARVREIVGRFKGRIDYWDVVNEAVAVERFRDKNRMSQWALHLGRTEYTAAPLRIAREANPAATLLVNDYRTDPPYADLLETLKDGDRYLFDAIGIQSHMHGGVWPIARVWETCERYRSFGVPLHFTEVTIVSGPKTDQGWETTPEGEARQADYVAKLYTTLFSHPSVQAVTWWDLADRGAWQRAPAGWLRRDLSPKPVYDRLMKLVKGDWWTTAAGATDPQGEFHARGFFGTYALAAETADGRTGKATVHVGKGEENRFELRVR